MFLIYQSVTYHFIPLSSKSTLCGSVCDTGTFVPCQLARWEASSVESPGGILEEKQFWVSVHPLSWQPPVMPCDQQHTAPLHGTSLSNPEGDFPLSQCSPPMNFSAIQWATIVPWGLDPSFVRAEAPFHICFFLGCSVLSLEVVAALYICYFCIP